jgi:hypothetical protein
MTTKTSHKAKQRPWTYAIETNRAVRDSIRWVQDFLEQHGIQVTRVAHLTSLLLERPATMTWDEFKAIIRKIVQPRIGSVMITSCRTGSVFLCSNRGNQPGEFQRLA